MTETHHASVAYIQINAADELAIGARGHNDRLTDQNRFRQRVMGMTGQDHVNAGNALGHLLVHIETVVGQANNQFRTLPAHLIDHFLHALVADAERILGEHPAGVRDGHIGEGLPDHGDFHAAALIELIGGEILGGFIPFRVKDILAKCGERQIAYNIAHTVRAEREFPVEGHCIGFQQVHDVHDILPFSFVASVGAVPCIAAIQQQRIGTISANAIDHSRHAVHATHLAIGLTKGCEIIIAQRVVRRATVFDAVQPAEICASDMRHLPFVGPNAKVDFGLAEPDRLQLRMNVRDVDQRNIAESIKLKQIALAQRLLRRQLAPVAKAGCSDNRRSRHASLQKIAT